MRVFSRTTLNAYAAMLKAEGAGNHKAVKAALDAWYAEVAKAEWTSPQRLKDQFGSASVVSASRVVFNIKGNDYRLIVDIDYARRGVFVKWLGTHAEYDRIDARSVRYDP
jgi:mRNA interferase HigB